MNSKTLLGTIVLATCVLRPTRADVIFDLIAYTGEQAAGTTGVFTNLTEFAANASGRVAISATIFGAGIDSTRNEGIWTGLPSALSLYAQSRNPAPGLPSSPTAYLGPFGPLDMNGSGVVVFNGQLGGAFTDECIWAGPPGAIALVARANNGPSPQFATFGPAVINASGKIAFTATLGAGSTPENNRGIWAGTAGAAQLVARANSQAPGTPNGIFFNTFGDPVLSDTGALAFVAALANAAPNQDSGIWSGPTAASLKLLARRGFSAPGTGNGPQFSIFEDPVINNMGDVCFAASLQASGVSALSSNGIWAGTPTNLSLVVRSGQPAPGLASGINFLSFQDPVLNDAGQVAFIGTVTGPGISSANNSVVYAGAPGSLRLIAQGLGQAPGLTTGALFDTIQKVLMDANGRVAIFARLTGAVTPGFASGIWAEDNSAVLQLVVWEGQIVEFPSLGQVPFVANGLSMLGDRRIDFSVFGPGRIPIEAVFDRPSGVAPQTTAWFFANLVSAGPALSAEILAGQVSISFSSATGVSYQMEYTDTLNPINWQPLGPTLSGTGGIMTVTDPLANGAGQRYYRLLTL